MAWIQLHQALRRHPKLLHAARILNLDDPDVLRAKLENIWLWCLDHAEAGVITIDSKLPLDVWVKEAGGWQGPTNSFAEALLEAGWLDKIAAGKWGYKLQVHDWHEYAGRLMAQREADRDRKRAARSGGRPEDGGRRGEERRGEERREEERRRDEPPGVAPPSTPEEEREVDRTVAAFGFTSTPAVETKQKAIRDLRRLGLSHEWIRKVASEKTGATFWEIIRFLEKNRAIKSDKPKAKTCRKCGGLGQIQNVKAPIGVTDLVSCPECLIKV